MYNKKYIVFLKNASSKYIRLRIPMLAAQSSFYIVLAFFPFILFLLSLILKTQIESAILFKAIETVFPSSIHDLIVVIINDAFNTNTTAYSIGSIFATIWLSSRAVRSLSISINTIFESSKQRVGFKRLTLSIIITIAFVLLIIIVMLLIVFGQKIGNFFFSYLGTEKTFINIWHYIRYQLSVLFLLLVFILIYKTFPTKKISIKNVIPGAVFSTAAWLLLSTFFSLYTDNFFKFANIYGSILGVILLIIWVHWSMTAVLIGADIIAVLDEMEYL